MRTSRNTDSKKNTRNQSGKGNKNRAGNTNRTSQTSSQRASGNSAGKGSKKSRTVRNDKSSRNGQSGVNSAGTAGGSNRSSKSTSRTNNRTNTNKNNADRNNTNRGNTNKTNANNRTNINKSNSRNTSTNRNNGRNRADRENNVRATGRARNATISGAKVTGSMNRNARNGNLGHTGGNTGHAGGSGHTGDPARNARNIGKKRIFLRYMQEKLAAAGIIILLLVVAVTWRLYSIITKNQDKYTQIVLSQQSYDSRVIPYRRGDIVDRNGTYLATTEKVYNLIIDPQQIMSNEENYLDASVTALATNFGYDENTIRSLIVENKDKAYIRYARRLSYDDKEKFETYKTETNRANAKNDSKERVKGVWFEDEYRRLYPYNSLACNVIGFSGTDSGLGGIEQSYNSSLIGTNGREYGYLNDDSNLERVIKPATNGNTVVSTIDVNIQNAVEKRIQEWEQETGSKQIGVVVMDPDTAEVLAMASGSTFDLNNPREIGGRFNDDQIWQFGLKEATATWNRKHKDETPITQDQVRSYYSDDEIRSFGQQVAWNQIWRNYCISDTYEPGSPSKIFTVAAALEEGLISPNDTFFCDGFQEIAGVQIKCDAWKRGGHGVLTLEETLMQSCNDAMMQIAAKGGAALFSRYQKMFGFGAKTGIDLPGEADTKNLIYDADNLRPVELATNSFGQGYNCTMIQMAAAYCSVINGGSYYEPHVVRQVLDEQGSVVKKIEPKLVRETVSESTSTFIKHALFRTVNEGTGRAAAVAGYDIAGKTGTAEKIPRRQGNYLLSFCGFAPADDPQVLVYVTIDEPHVEDQAHSSYAAGVFSKIMQDILPYMNVFPAVDAQNVDEALAAQLPGSEGITDNSAETAEAAPAETKVYDTDEYVDSSDGGNGIPENMPAGAETQETEIVIDPGTDAIDMDNLPDVSAQVSVNEETVPETAAAETEEAAPPETGEPGSEGTEETSAQE